LPDNKKKNNYLVLFRFLSLLIVLFTTITVAIIGIIIYLNSPLPLNKMPFAVSEDGIRILEDGSFHVDIRKGESSQSAGLRLERAGIIRNRYFWNLLCRLEKDHIKSGTYRIEVPLNQIAVHRLLVLGKQILYRVTIPEGVTLKKTAAILEEAGICSADDFVETAKDPQILNFYNIPNMSMEGYLFPDTYLFPSEYPASGVIKAMADNFYNKIEIINPSVIRMNPQELNDKIILASIVEREYRISDEAPLMAGVFYNRLNINMALQSCATIEYIIAEILNKPHPSVIYNQDLEIYNPYNTYIKIGLPPGPISAPGIVALQAVMYPKKTDYFYFRLDDPQTGKHFFSRTLDEHISGGQLIPKGQF
jgi:UPF0755 protein